MSEEDERRRRVQDRDAVYELEQRLDRGESLSLDDSMRDLLRRVGEDVALDVAYVAERLTTPERAAELLREEHARIRDGSHALSAITSEAERLVEARKYDEACSLLEDYMKREPVPWYQEMARRNIERIKREERAPRPVWLRRLRRWPTRLYGHFLANYFILRRRVQSWWSGRNQHDL